MSRATAKLISIFSAAAMLAGCSTPELEGPTPALDEHGVVLKDNENIPQTALFKSAYEKSYNDMLKGTTGTDVQKNAIMMLRTGFASININCNRYFVSLGADQNKVMLASDLNTATTTLVTSALSAAGSISVLSPVNLASGGISGYLDQAKKNFYFGMDNIEPIRDLAATSLAAHQKAALLAAEQDSTQDFLKTNQMLMDDQSYCTIMGLKTLAKGALSNAHPTVVDTTTGKPAVTTPPAANKNEVVRGTLAPESNDGSQPKPPAAVVNTDQHLQLDFN